MNKTVNHPSLEERKSFWLFQYSLNCFSAVVAGCEYLIRNSNSLDRSVFNIMSAGLIVTYAKPFTKCHGAGSLEEKMIPAKDRKIHEHLLDLRHKTVAHLDAVNFRADDKQFGNINQVRLKSTKDGYEFSGILLPLDMDRSKVMRNIATTLINKLDYHIDRFTRKYVDGNSLKPDEYTLNLDPSKPEPFLPAKPLVAFNGPSNSVAPPHATAD